jgi:hypothetical protein
MRFLSSRISSILFRTSYLSFFSSSCSHRQDFAEGSVKLHVSIQPLEESMGNKGVVIVDADSHHEDVLRSLDYITDSAVIPTTAPGQHLTQPCALSMH